MALTKVTGQVINTSTDVTVGVLTVTNTLAVGGTVSIGGTLTYEDVTNIDSVGLITARNGIVVGSGITLSKDGDGFFTGVVTATSYAGDGSALTGIDATQIVTGNTSVQTVDTGSDGHVKVNTEGSERLRIIADGKVGVNKTAPNFHLDVAGNIGLTEGQVITWHDGSGTKAGDMYIDSSDNFILRNTSSVTERFRIDSNGDLGLGIAAVPQDSGARTLHVHSTTTGGSARAALRLTHGSTGSAASNGGFLGMDNNPDLSLFNQEDGNIKFGTNGNERMRIHETGRVSIGDNNSDSHDYKLVVEPNLSDSSKGSLGILIDGNSGTGGGPSVDAISLKSLCTATWNNSTKQYAGWFETNQQLTQPQIGVYSKVAGTYSTARCYEAILNKNLAATTDGISYYSNVVPTNSGGAVYHFFGQDNGTTKIYIEQDGDVKNANNSYGSTSDVKLKENIVDANSQWDDIKGLRIRNFNFKNDPDKVKMLGVVAQEAETVSAGLIDTKNDVEVDSDTGEGKITGTTKYVKYSILYMKAVKALQEAQTRIETLETEVAALKSN